MPMPRQSTCPPVHRHPGPAGWREGPATARNLVASDRPTRSAAPERHHRLRLPRPRPSPATAGRSDRAGPVALPRRLNSAASGARYFRRTVTPTSFATAKPVTQSRRCPPTPWMSRLPFHQYRTSFDESSESSRDSYRTSGQSPTQRPNLSAHRDMRFVPVTPQPIGVPSNALHLTSLSMSLPPWPGHRPSRGTARSLPQRSSLTHRFSTRRNTGKPAGSPTLP